MVVGKIVLNQWQLQQIKEYLLGGLTGIGDPVIWGLDGKCVVGTDGSLKIVEGTCINDRIIFDYPRVRIPMVPLSSETEPQHRTHWLQVAIAIADQVGLTSDPEVMRAIECRVTEEVLEGKMTADEVRGKVATTENGKSTRQFAWSRDGQLAAKIGETWRLASGEAVNVDNQWSLMQL